MIITKCPKCQHENREGARFCLKCGAKLENLCHKCGAKLPPGARFCDECGAKIAETELKIPIPKLEDAYMHLQSVMPGSLAVKLQSAPPDIEGENRIISILFGDIGNSVGITEKMAPEDAAELINKCVNVMVDIILKYEGSIENIMRFLLNFLHFVPKKSGALHGYFSEGFASINIDGLTLSLLLFFLLSPC